jgi:hypothetical protein
MEELQLERILEIDPVSGKTRICFAKDLHALLRLGADCFFLKSPALQGE